MRAPITPELNSLIRDLVSRRGQGVFSRVDAHGESSISIYGWGDYKNILHTSDVSEAYGAEGCSWVIPDHATAQIINYRLYRGPDRSLKTQRGLNVFDLSCACGRYKNVTVRIVAPEVTILAAGHNLPSRLPAKFAL